VTHKSKNWRAKQAANYARVKEIQAAAGDKPLSDDQRREIARLSAENQQLTLDIDAEERAADRETNANARISDDQLAVIRSKARAGIAEPYELELLNRWGGDGATGRARGPKFAQMFPQLPLSSGGFASVDEYLTLIHSGQADSRLVPGFKAAMSGSDPSGGGFAVPTQFLANWLDSSLENEIVRPRAFIQPMTSDTAKAPAWDDADHTGGQLFGGFSGGWTPELGTISEQDAKVRAITLHAHKLALLARASNELIADGAGFDQQLGRAIVAAIGYFLDRAYLVGTGAGQPLGVLNAAATISVTRASAGDITYEDVCNVFSRMAPASLQNAVWVCSQTAIPRLLQLSVTVGVAGSHVPVLTESNGRFRILTKEVLFTERLPQLGTRGDLLFADFSKYICALRSDATLEKSGHAGFATDSTYYRAKLRGDGGPMLDRAITPENGSTLSPFVTLAA
jgi:HK97 family phage major capsid protein